MNFRFTIRLLTGLVGIGLAQSLFADDRPVVISLFGDSISVGENITSYYSECTFGGNPQRLDFRPGFGLGRTDYCTPDRELQRILLEQNRPAIVANWGVGGSLTGSNNLNGVSRIQANLNQTRTALPDGKDYFVLILYGTNDASPIVNNPPSVVAANINTMIARARAVGWTPIVGNLLPRTGVNVTAWNTQIRNAAIAAGAPFVDHFANFPFGQLEVEDNLGFGSPLRLHPTKEGYITVAQHWFDQALQNLIEEVKSPVIIGPLMLLLDDEPMNP